MKRSLYAVAAAVLSDIVDAGTAPFLKQVDTETWILGNELWNVTQGRTFGTKLFYKDRDLVGDAWGHYVSYDGAASNLNWTSAAVVAEGRKEGNDFIDIKFTATEGDMHWVIVSGLSGAYQYFVNRGLPTLGEFRTLWRLDNTTFVRGRTDAKDDELPPLSDYIADRKVQDETWLRPEGKGYITKYDFADWVRTQDYYGVYGDEAGSWYIHPSKDYLNGNHLKQELFVHRESSTGDAVQLNMLHGTHFQQTNEDEIPEGKIWGPWLWYLNGGSQEDAASRAKAEATLWPYAFLAERDEAYATRGAVRGSLRLSDGRAAAGAAVFLGDSGSTKTALDQGAAYYYTAYAGVDGAFEISGVRAGEYGLQAWSAGGELANVTTSFLRDGVSVEAGGGDVDLGSLDWVVSNRSKLFQIGDFDRSAAGFRYGAAPRQHGLVDECPASLVWTAGESQARDWCFGQTHRGNWTVVFDAPDAGKGGDGRGEEATLIVSLAGYSEGASSVVLANGKQIGALNSGDEQLANDPALYRSGTAAGEWRYFEFAFDAELLRPEGNEVTFQLVENTTWRGFMWDSVVLEW